MANHKEKYLTKHDAYLPGDHKDWIHSTWNTSAYAAWNFHGPSAYYYAGGPTGHHGTQKAMHYASSLGYRVDKHGAGKTTIKS